MALENSMSISAAHNMGGERPDCVDGETVSTVPSHNLQHGPETTERADSKRSQALESGSEASSDRDGHCRSLLSTREEPIGFVATPRDTRGQMAHHAAGGAGAQRPFPRRRKRWRGRKKHARDVVGSGGSGGNEKLPFLPPSPLQPQGSWPLMPSSLFSSSLMDAHSIYSGTSGRSKTSRPSVITGPFTNRQGSFRDRHVRPRTAGDCTNPTRSAVLIYVTTRSNFDVPVRQPQTVSGSASSRSGGGDSKGWLTKPSSSARPHHRGGVNNLGDSSGGWRVHRTTTSSTDTSHEVMSSGRHPGSPPPPLQRRPSTVPLDAMRASLHGAEEGARAWLRDERAADSRDSARRQLLLRTLRGGNSAAGKMSSNDCHQQKAWPARARTTATRRTGLTASGSCSPENCILSPERAAARLAGIRKAYGPESTGPFRGSSLYAATMKSSPSPSFSAHRRGRG